MGPLVVRIQAGMDVQPECHSITPQWAVDQRNEFTGGTGFLIPSNSTGLGCRRV